MRRNLARVLEEDCGDPAAAQRACAGPVRRSERLPADRRARAARPSDR
jgi:hypothetical protein